MIEPFTLCLALNIYHEARGEPLPGQIAVALVTLRRANYDKSKVCSVVFKRKQFSWSIHHPLPIKEKLAWRQSVLIAKAAWHFHDFMDGATHYHADYVYPKWADSLTYLGQIGNHHFYRR